VKRKKKKAVNVRLVDRQTEPEPYRMMDDLIMDYHPHLEQARVALAWRYGWTSDKDGRLILGQCRKASDLDREFREFDAVILLNREVWEEESFTAAQKLAVIDHELCHLQLSEDKDGDPIRDERGRLVYRLRKHDLEEFRDVVNRHGCYKADLQAFAQVLLHSRANKTAAPLFPKASVKLNGPAFKQAVGEELRNAGFQVEEDATVDVAVRIPEDQPAADPQVATGSFAPTAGPGESSVASLGPPSGPFDAVPRVASA
jgi:hypothetical protein